MTGLGRDVGFARKGGDVKSIRIFLAIAAVLVVVSSLHLSLAQGNAAEEEVWKLEEAYWKYVKANDLQSYRSLWHERFVGWPSIEKAPVEKSKIGGWIISRTEKGQSLRSYELRRQAVRQIGDVVVVHYLVTYVWVDKAGKLDGDGQWSRITHTWVKAGGKWQIVTGMSAVVPKNVH